MMLTGSDIARLRKELETAGWGEDVTWSESCQPPIDADAFAREAIYVICNSGMRFTIARRIFKRVMEYVTSDRSATGAFGHIGKATAIDAIWNHRQDLLDQFTSAEDKIAFCERLPWIGSITKYHLAKNLGVDVAKPDVHLKRLADAHGTTAHQLCERLAEETGLRIATVDVILWRACATGLLVAA